jgi:membrane protein DedA with SNARE-associated domain
MHEIITTITNFASELWYTWIFIMMVLESSFFPFPSEVAMIPAWYLASTWEMDFFIALIVWTFWAIVWATINYVIWYYLWKKTIHKIVKKYWKFFLITIDHIKSTEKYFENHWSITTFLGRFITVVRQLISIPAWMFKMNFTKFFIYTLFWAMLWNLILMTIWYIAWENKELIAKYSYEILLWSIIFIIIIANIYYYLHKKKYVTK